MEIDLLKIDLLYPYPHRHAIIDGIVFQANNQNPHRHGQPISLQISISSLSRICPNIWSIRSWFLTRHSWFQSGVGLVEVGGTNGEDRFPMETVQVHLGNGNWNLELDLKLGVSMLFSVKCICVFSFSMPSSQFFFFFLFVRLSC